MPLNAIVKVGADPEFFLQKDGVLTSAHGLIPGDKHNPFKLSKGACQLDGTAVEFNIDPASTVDAFIENIDKTLEEIRQLVPPEYKFHYQPAVFYPQDYFDSLPENVKELGCNPDHDAYKDGERNPVPDRVGTMCTGSGHVHIGFCEGVDPFSDEHMADCVILTKQLDDYFGGYIHKWDKDQERKKMYGKLGCFRPKSYGLEYRTLSNAWLNERRLWPWIFESIQYVYRATLAGASTRDSYFYDNEEYHYRPVFPIGKNFY